jgi:hypothetical protein
VSSSAIGVAEPLSTLPVVANEASLAERRAVVAIPAALLMGSVWQAVQPFSYYYESCSNRGALAFVLQDNDAASADARCSSEANLRVVLLIANLIAVPPTAVALARRHAPEVRGVLFLSLPILALGDLILLIGALLGRLQPWDLTDDAACGGDDVLCDQWGMLPLALSVIAVGTLGVVAGGLGALRRRARR